MSRDGAAQQQAARHAAPQGVLAPTPALPALGLAAVGRPGNFSMPCNTEGMADRGGARVGEAPLTAIFR